VSVIQARPCRGIQRAGGQRLGLLRAAGVVGELVGPGIQQHPHLHDLPRVADGVGEPLRGDLLGFGPGGGVAEHVDLLVGPGRVLGWFPADEYLHGAAQPAQADLPRPAVIGQPGAGRPPAQAVAGRRAEAEHGLPGRGGAAADQQPRCRLAERRQGDAGRLGGLDRLADQPPGCIRPGVDQVH